MTDKDDKLPLWQGRGHVESYGDDENPVQLFGNPPPMTISGLEVHEALQLSLSTNILQEIFDKLCRARDNADTIIIETVLDQVIEMIVKTADDNHVPLDRRNRLIASIQTL